MEMAKHLLYRLTSPWRYLIIRDKSKFLRMINWVLPFFITIIIMGLAIFFGGDFFPVDCAKNGLGKMVTLFGILPGFFLTALSAVAVFDREGMDEVLPGAIVSVTTMIDGEIIRVDVTRRRFLCMMFSFLTAQSFLLFLVISVMSSLLVNFNRFWKWTIYSIICFLFIQIICVTLHGLYYLGDRLSLLKKKNSKGE